MADAATDSSEPAAVVAMDGPGNIFLRYTGTVVRTAMVSVRRGTGDAMTAVRARSSARLGSTVGPRS